jgi:predicted AlkP superfamily phosphohydrolase/phosphomutase
MKRALGGLGVEAYALVRALRRSGLGWLPKLVPRARSQGPMAKASLAPIAKNVDWSSTRVYCPSAAGSELRVNLRGREAHGIVDPDDFERVCHEVRQALLQLTDPATGRKVVRAVHLRHEIYQGPHAENGADLLVETTDPYCLVDDVGATSIVPAGQSTGERTAHDLRNGIFMLAGTAARRGAAIPELDICDVAPTLLHLIGLPVQDDMDGTVAAAALTESHRAAHPIQTDQLTLPPETEQVEIDDRDRRAIDGAPEGLGYL